MKSYGGANQSVIADARGQHLRRTRTAPSVEPSPDLNEHSACHSERSAEGAEARNRSRPDRMYPRSESDEGSTVRHAWPAMRIACDPSLALGMIAIPRLRPFGPRSE